MSERTKESAWDYPRPPRVEPTDRHLKVVLGGVVVAETEDAYRVLETSHPPNYYFPAGDVTAGAIERSDGASLCEFKGRAHYFTVRGVDREVRDGAWGYDTPSPAFEPITGYVSFYASRMDECYVDDELVVPQEGNVYGGWITIDVEGPFKGGPGTRGW